MKRRWSDVGHTLRKFFFGGRVRSIHCHNLARKLGHEGSNNGWRDVCHNLETFFLTDRAVPL